MAKEQLLLQLALVLPSRKCTEEDIDELFPFQNLSIDLTNTYFSQFVNTSQLSSSDKICQAAQFFDFLCEMGGETECGLWLLTQSTKEERRKILLNLIDILKYYKYLMDYIDDTTEEDRQLRATQFNMEDEITKFEQDINVDEEQIERYKKEKKRQTSVDADILKGNKALDIEMDNIRKEIEVLEKRDNELDDDLKTLKSREKQLENQLVGTSLNDLTCENVNYVKENAKLQDEISSLKYREEDHIKKRGKVNSAVSDLSMMCTELESCGEYSNEIQSLQNTIERLVKDIDDAKQTTQKLRILDPVQSSDDNYKEFLTNAQIELEQSKQTVDSARDEYEHASSENMRMKRAVQDENLFKDLHEAQRRLRNAKDGANQAKNGIVEALLDAVDAI
ncbi:unnamed protein product [Didymodactylos carnosus]|uniref:Uncharacterized protein n=1 Tax=Didymodactylos carnosus TaxID=1234261 RepID=A0A813S5Q9_9BILA|nr:unnamed protein product [Didymodactylos carnosus]CAF1193737.1 unnamed protein product [Didymodactylos carnosus]CAF3575879.1 unnamed protein product [Didymodactylos carnosus]CAF4004020.1 unnamed protein product [Didymodactylos carnosus]